MYIYVYDRIYIYVGHRETAEGDEDALVHCVPQALQRAQRHPRLQGAGFRVQGAGFRVQGSGCRVQGSGFRVHPADSRTSSASSPPAL